MTIRRNSLVAAALAMLGAAPAVAQEINYLSRSDRTILTTGDAPAANLAIQHPTPWPSYVNDTNFRTPARQSMSALEQMFKRYEGGSKSTPSTVINIGGQQ